MERTTMVVLAIGAVLLAGSAEARTRGPVCKTECAPRIAEQCGSLRGKGRRVCRRQLMQGCKQTTPIVACTTTSDMTLALADQSFAVGAGIGTGFASSGPLTLCGDGRFTFRGSSGTWAVTIVSGGLTLNLRTVADIAEIADGTSNTILIAEGTSNTIQGTEEQFRVVRADEDVVLFDDQPVDAEDAGQACGGSRTSGDAPGRNGSGGSGGDLDAITRALGNKSLRVQSSELFSGGSISTERTLELCSSGSVLLVETTVTSGSTGGFSNTFDSTERFDGTWSVRLAGGEPTLELALGEPEPGRFAVEVDAGGAIFLDGRPADVSDASACGAGTPGPTGGSGGSGGADPGQELTDALAGHALIVVENSIGFGRRTTIIVLCASGRYAMEVTVSAVPGSAQDSTGTWSAGIEGSEPVLTLVDDGGASRQFAIASDAGGGLLLDGLTVGEGDPSAVPGICARL